MVGPGVSALGEGLSGGQRLQVVAVLLGVLVFGMVILVVERRNHGHEVTPPGMSPRDAPRPPPRQVYRPPAQSVPTMSGREAAAEAAADNPYPTPFGRAETAPPEGADSPPAEPPQS